MSKKKKHEEKLDQVLDVLFETLQLVKSDTITIAKARTIAVVARSYIDGLSVREFRNKHSNHVSIEHYE
jgi:hypothetical protein